MIIVHTPTISDYREIVKFIICNNITWNNGSKLIHEEYWICYDREETCIIINNNELIVCAPLKLAFENYEEPILNKSEFYSKFYNQSREEFAKKNGLI